MKYTWMLMVALLWAGCTARGDKGEPKEEPATSEAEWVEVVLQVEGMTCEGCENAIRTGVGSLEGVAEVESSHEAAWTRVKYDKNLTSLEEISAKITETGYEVKGEKTGSVP
jgi:copper chaperone